MALNKRPQDYDRVMFHLVDDDMKAALERRARDGESFSLVARTAVERYLTALELDLRSLRGVFTEAELCLMADAVNGVLYEAHTIPQLAGDVDDHIQLNQADTRFKVDGAALLEKLHRLTAGQTFALVDSLERFWRTPEAGADREGFAQVGLIASRELKRGRKA